MTIYDFEVEKMNGKQIALKNYQNKLLLIVNTASKCGYTKQFKGLEELYLKYQNKGFLVLGFPSDQFLKQEFKDNAKILAFCQLNYGVTFEMFKKIKVKGKKQHPLYAFLVNNSPVNQGKKIKWNFEKFLISQDGLIIKRYQSKITPMEIEEDIIKALQ